MRLRYCLTDLRVAYCDEGSWMELAQDSVQRRALTLPKLNLTAVLQEQRLQLRNYPTFTSCINSFFYKNSSCYNFKAARDGL
jgi:hypothetical protein